MEVTFQVDLAILNDNEVPFESKKMMLDIILDDLVPYRYHDGPRLFPAIDFFTTLLYNRADFYQIWSFVARFHDWVSMLAFQDPVATDEAIESLRTLRDNRGQGPSALCPRTPQDHPRQSAQGEQRLARDDSHLLDRPSEIILEPNTRQSEMRLNDANTNGGTESATEDTMKKRTRLEEASKTEAAGQHPLLVEELAKPATFLYRGIIQDMAHFEELDGAYDRHLRKPAGLVPEQDQSWPEKTEQQREYVGFLSSQITNMVDFYELRKARERLVKVGGDAQQDAEDEPSSKRRRIDKSEGKRDRPRPKGVNKADWELMDENNSPMDLLTAITHHPMSDIEIELLCWRLLVAAMNAQRGFSMRPLWSGHRTVATWDSYKTFAERWQVMSEKLLDCKLLIHSLTRADWIAKFASAPEKERASKLSNDLLNGRRDIQNQVGREVIKTKTVSKEWMTTESYEIRTTEGDLVVKGVPIGDQARRKLAVREQGASSSSSP